MAKGGKRAVDIFTDSGVVDRLGSWAAVIVRVVGSRGIVEASGPLRAETDTFAGEARAIANGLHHALKSGMIGPGELVAVRCDNEAVVKAFSGQRRAKRPLRRDVKEVRDYVKRLARLHKFRLRFAHIKAHRDPNCGSLFVLMNARADHLCCRELGSAREKSSSYGVTDKQIETLSAQLQRSYRLSTMSEAVARLTGL